MGKKNRKDRGDDKGDAFDDKRPYKSPTYGQKGGTGKKKKRQKDGFGDKDFEVVPPASWDENDDFEERPHKSSKKGARKGQRDDRVRKKKRQKDNGERGNDFEVVPAASFDEEDEKVSVKQLPPAKKRRRKGKQPSKDKVKKEGEVSSSSQIGAASFRKLEDVKPEVFIARFRRKRAKIEEQYSKALDEAKEKKKLSLFHKLLIDFGNKKEMAWVLKATESLAEAKAEPSVFTLTNLVNALVRCGELTRAQEAFDSGFQGKVKPNEITFTALLKGYVDDSRPDLVEAKRIYQRMVGKPPQGEGLTPTLRTYTMLLRSCVTFGDLEWALSLMEELEENELERDEQIYVYLLRLFCQSGEIEEAAELTQSMEEQGLTPTIPMYQALMVGEALARRAGPARSALTSLQAALQKQPAAKDSKDALFLKTQFQEAIVISQRVREWLSNKPASWEGGTCFTSSPYVKDLRASSTASSSSSSLHELLDLPAWFGNNHPVHLEICSGSGDWIVNRAKCRPEINWVLLERRLDRVYDGWANSGLFSLPNIRFLVGDAVVLLRQHLRPDSVEHAYINFPVPPVRSTLVGDLLSAEFLSSVHSMLNKLPGLQGRGQGHAAAQSQLSILTDDPNYAILLGERFTCAPLAQLFSSRGQPGQEALKFSTSVPDDYGSGSYFDRFFDTRNKQRRFYFNFSPLPSAASNVPVPASKRPFDNITKYLPLRQFKSRILYSDSSYSEEVEDSRIIDIAGRG
eukprot:g1526.t1